MLVISRFARPPATVASESENTVFTKSAEDPLLLLAMERKTFDRELRRFLVRHAKRGVLLRRLTETGLWQ